MYAYILMTVDSAEEESVFEALKKKPNVLSCNLLFGEWDIIVRVEIPDAQALGAFVLHEVRGLTGVKVTSTLIAAR